MADPQYVSSKAAIVAGYARAAGDDNELREILQERVPQYLGEVLAGQDTAGLSKDSAQALTALRNLIPSTADVWMLPAPQLHKVRDAIERLGRAA